MIIGIICLLLLILIYTFFYKFFGIVMISAFLAGVVLIALIDLFRTIFLLKFPIIIIDDSAIRYFNILWYNTYYLNQFEIAEFDDKSQTVTIGLTNGRILDKFKLDSLSQQEIDEIKRYLLIKDKLKIEGTKTKRT